MGNSSGDRVVDADSIASVGDIKVGDLFRVKHDDGFTLGRVAKVEPLEDGSGVELTFGIV